MADLLLRRWFVYVFDLGRIAGCRWHAPGSNVGNSCDGEPSMNSVADMIQYDARWESQPGIGRFARELHRRLPIW